eukprot:TRINITY_DN25118_c0_g1_i1.p1 TRINITY_DN25118_c0_g1~~TRINITY_DN25118_c0_g1_i1.p1  ORF type:complete len:966 (-),score=151.27 TRINITY_DN25118_c0_g1_i1:98-2950(-)
MDINKLLQQIELEERFALRRFCQSIGFNQGAFTDDDLPSAVVEYIRKNENKSTYFEVLGEPYKTFVSISDDLARMIAKAENCLDVLPKPCQNLPFVQNVFKILLPKIKKSLNDKEFCILVFGDSNSGKSTFINSVLGDDLLPMSGGNCTLEITEVKFGDTEKLSTFDKDSNKEKEVPLKNNLKETLKNLLDPKIRANGPTYARVRVEIPNPILKSGLVLVDTPGFNDPLVQSALNGVFDSYWRKSLACICVMSLKSGATESVIDVLNKILAENKKSEEDKENNTFDREIFFVGTHVDSGKGAEQALSSFKATMKARYPLFTDEIYAAIDGQSALWARQLNVPMKTMEGFMQKLATFLKRTYDQKISCAKSAIDELKFVQMLVKRMRRYQAAGDHEKKRQMDFYHEVQRDIGAREKELLSFIVGKLRAISNQYRKCLAEANPDLIVAEVLRQIGQLPENLAQYPDSVISKIQHTAIKECMVLFLELETASGLSSAINEEMTTKTLKVVKEIEDKILLMKDLGGKKRSKERRNLPTWIPLLYSIPILIAFLPLTLPIMVGLFAADKIKNSTNREKMEKDWSSFVRKNVKSAMKTLVSSTKDSPSLVLPKDLVSLHDSSFPNGQLDQLVLQNWKKRVEAVKEEIEKLKAKVDALIMLLKSTQNVSEEVLNGTVRNLEDIIEEFSKIYVVAQKATVDTTKVVIGNKIGSGQHSVFDGTYNNLPVAIKQVSGLFSFRSLLEEDHVLSYLKTRQSPYLIGYQGYYAVHNQGDWKFYLLMERAEKSLEDLIHSTNLSDLEVVDLAIQIAKGMEVLHDCGFVHRDLKPANILIGYDRAIKIADFGEIARGKELSSTKKGTPIYNAPEVFDEQSATPQTPAVDVYSFGVVLWEMCHRKVPFGAVSLFDLKDHVLKGNRPEFSERCPPALKDLITLCWNQNPDTRPTWNDIISKLRAFSE